MKNRVSSLPKNFLRFLENKEKICIFFSPMNIFQFLLFLFIEFRKFPFSDTTKLRNLLGNERKIVRKAREHLRIGENFDL